MLVAAVLGGLLPILSLVVLVSRFGSRRWAMRKAESFTQVEMAPALTRPQVREIRGQLPLLMSSGSVLDADVHRIDSNMISHRTPRRERHPPRQPDRAPLPCGATQTPEQKSVITDLSGPEGNGVVVNAERVEQAALAAGD